MTNWYSEESVKQLEQQALDQEQRRQDERERLAVAFETQMDNAGFTEQEKVKWREWSLVSYDEKREWPYDEKGKWSTLNLRFELEPPYGKVEEYLTRAQPEPEPEPEPEPVVANPVTLEDVNAVADYLAAGATLTTEQEAKYDVNGDGEVDYADYALLDNAYRDGDYAGFKEDTLFSPEPEPEPEPELDSDNEPVPEPVPVPEAEFIDATDTAEEIARPAEFVRADGTYSPLDLDQNGVVDALTDGLLVLRYLFGLTGDGVTKGALAGDATRTAEEVLEYLDWVKSHPESELYKAFDLDNSGEIDALTDGLMLLRHSFGLTGDAVTKGAISNPKNEEGVKVPTATTQEVVANLDNAISVLQQVPKDDEGNYGVTDSQRIADEAAAAKIIADEAEAKARASTAGGQYYHYVPGSAEKEPHPFADQFNEYNASRTSQTGTVLRSLLSRIRSHGLFYEDSQRNDPISGLRVYNPEPWQSWDNFINTLDTEIEKQLARDIRDAPPEANLITSYQKFPGESYVGHPKADVMHHTYNVHDLEDYLHEKYNVDEHVAQFELSTTHDLYSSNFELPPTLSGTYYDEFGQEIPAYADFNILGKELTDVEALLFDEAFRQGYRLDQAFRPSDINYNSEWNPADNGTVALIQGVDSGETTYHVDVNKAEKLKAAIDSLSPEQKKFVTLGLQEYTGVESPPEDVEYPTSTVVSPTEAWTGAPPSEIRQYLKDGYIYDEVENIPNQMFHSGVAHIGQIVDFDKLKERDLTPEQLAYLDANKDGEVSAADLEFLTTFFPNYDHWQSWQNAPNADGAAETRADVPVNPDMYDMFPNNPGEWFDYDLDGVGSVADAMDNNNPESAYIQTQAEYDTWYASLPDMDGDGLPDIKDADIDGDGYDNRSDPYMYDNRFVTAEGWARADTDGDGVINQHDPLWENAEVRNTEEYDAYYASSGSAAASDLGWQWGRKGDEISSTSFAHGQELKDNEGLLYQGYSIPLRPEELLEGYLAIASGDFDWVDPRYNKTLEYRNIGVPQNEGGRFAGSWYLGTSVSGFLNNYLGEARYETLKTASNSSLAEHFLALYSKGTILPDSYDPEVYQNSRQFEIPMGQDGSKVITIKDLFELQMPNLEGGRPEIPLPRDFVRGVDAMPTEEELGQYYMDLVLAQNKNFDTADMIMDLFPEAVKDMWDGIVRDKKLTNISSDFLYFEKLKELFPSSELLKGEGIFTVDTDFLRGLDFEGAGTDSFKTWNGIVADAIDKFNTDPKSLTFEERYYLEGFRQLETDLLYRPEVSEERKSEFSDLDLGSGTTLDALDDMYKYDLAASIYDNRATLFPYVQGNVTDMYKDKYDEYGYPPTYGLSMLGGSYFLNDKLYYVDGSAAHPNHHIPIEDAREGAYQSAWYSRVRSLDMPLYQETNILGYEPADMARLQELAGKNRNGAEETEYRALWDNFNSNRFSLGVLNHGQAHDFWYDPTRLFMKWPEHVTDDLRINGGTNEIMNHNNLLQNLEGGYSPFGGPENMNQYNMFNVGDNEYSPVKYDGGPTGWLMDISGGNAPVGSYSMVWVQQPPEPSFMDKMLNDPIFITGVSLLPGGALVIAAAKLLNGDTLKTEDYVGAIISALKISGKVKYPDSAARAADKGDKAKKAAEAAALADNPALTALQVAKIGDAAYSAAQALALADIGLGALTAAQTVDVVRVIGSGNVGDALFSVFGKEYIGKALGDIGIDFSKFSPNIQDGIVDIATNMLNGDSLEEAAAESVGRVVIDEFNSITGADNFFDSLIGDAKGAAETIGNIAEEAMDFLEPVVDAVKDIPALLNLEGLKGSLPGVQNALRGVEDALKAIGTDINKGILNPVEDLVLGSMSKFTTLGSLDLSLTGDVEEDIQKFVAGLSEAGKESWDGLGDGLKTVFEEAIGSELLGRDLSDQDKAKILSRELVSVEAISKLDGALVDAIGPKLLTSAVRNALNAAMLGGSTGQMFLTTIAQGTVEAIKSAYQAGGLQAVSDEFSDFGDKISGDYGEAKDLAAQYNTLDDQYVVLLNDKKRYEDDLTDMVAERNRLSDLANDDYATQDDVDNFTAFKAQYTAAAPAIISQINILEGEIETLQLEFEPLSVAYNNALGELTTETQNLDAALALQYEDLYLATLVQFNPELANQEALEEYASINNVQPSDGETVTAADVAQHYLSTGMKEGAPVTNEEFTTRLNAAVGSNVAKALEYRGVDITQLSPVQLQNMATVLLNQSTATGAELIEIFENNVGVLDAQIELGEDNPSLVSMYDGVIQEATGESSFDFRLSSTMSFLGMSDADLRDISMNNVSYTVDPNTGDIVWGGDGHTMREWNSSTQEFETYRYDAGGGLKYRLNEDGSEPSVKVYEQTPMFSGIDDLAKNSPASYMTFLAQAPTDAALNATVLHMENIEAPQDQIDQIKDVQAAIAAAPEDDGQFAVPDSELPWIIRVARDWLQTSKDYEDTLSAQIEALESKDTLEVDEELSLLVLKEGLENVEGNTQFLANYVVKTPTKINAFVETSLRGFGAWMQGIGAEKEADAFRRQALAEGKSREEADQIFRDKYAELSSDIDYISVVDNDATQLHNMMESLARGYLPDIYLEDQKEMSENIAAADGAIDTVAAVFGEVIDKPDVFLGTYLGDELPTFFVGLGISATAGRLTSLASTKILGKEIVEGLADGSSTAVSVNVILDLAEAFGETTYSTYEEAKLELERSGYEGDIEAKAAEIAIKSGTAATVMVAATAPFGAFALDNAILSSATKKVVKEVAQRVEGVATTLTKETATEVIQGGFTQGATEVYLYNAGVTDRDVAGNIAGSATMEGLVGGTTAGVTLGMSMPTDGGAGPLGGDPFANLIFSNPDIQTAVNSGNPIEVRLALENANVVGTPMYVEVMNTVDDANFTTVNELDYGFTYLGVDASYQDAKGVLDANPDLKEVDVRDAVEAYWVNTYGQEAIGTGRTTAQHYDIIQYITAMANGEVPLDPSFNYNGDNMVSEEDVAVYISRLPQREQDLYASYDVSTHQDTGIAEELGGIINMNSEDLKKLQANIETLLARPNPPTQQEIVDVLLNDPDNSNILKGQIETAVANVFASEDSQKAIATAVVDQLVTDGTIKTEATAAVKDVVGDPNAETPEGIFKLVEDLKSQIGLGETNSDNLVAYIDGAIGTAVELNADGTVKEGTGSGLLGELTAQGVLQDVAIAEIQNMLGSPSEGDNPATGIYAIASSVEDVEAAISALDDTLDRLETTYGASLTALETNLGLPTRTEMVDGVEVTQPATGLYAKVEEAVAAGVDAEAAVANILGEYVDFAAFETAFNTTLNNKITEISNSFGTAPVYAYEDDGVTVKRDEEGNLVLAQAATGIQADIFNAMQLEGAERDLALIALDAKIDSTMTELQQFTTETTASAIKSDILDVYFPAKPADFSDGRQLTNELEYIQQLVATGQLDVGYDSNNDGQITQEDYDAVINNLTPEQATALENYNSWVSNSTGITPALEAFGTDTATSLKVLDNRIAAVENNVIQTLTANVNSVIGSPSDGVNAATGIYKAIADGDSDVLDVLGSKGEDGSGVLRDLELLGLSNAEIKTFLDTNLGLPATGEIPATGIYAAVAALESSNKERYDALSKELTTLQTDLDKAISTAVTDIQAEIGTPSTTETNDAGEEVEVPATGIYATIEANVASGLSRDEATQKAVADLAGELGTTEAELLKELGITQTALELGITTLQTDLETKIAENEAAGLKRDEATQQAVADLAAELGITEQDILGQLGITQEALSGEITAVGEQVTGVEEDIAEVGASIEDIATLLGKPANEVTQEDVNIATQYLDSVEQENELLYDVDNSGTFDQTDVNLMQSAVTDQDYSGFVDSDFGLATGMFATQEANEAQIAQQQADAIAREAQYQQDLAAKAEADQQARTELEQNIKADFRQQLDSRAEEEEKQKMLDAFTAPGRQVTTKPGDRAQIPQAYDFDSIFGSGEQESFYSAASPYGDNFLDDILNPKRQGTAYRAKGGIIKDKTDEILKIIGDK